MQEAIKNKAGIAEVVSVCLKKQVHFVAYRLPGENAASVIVQKDAVVHTVGKMNRLNPRKGFLIAPFSRDDHEAWLLSPDLILDGDTDNDLMDELLSIPDNQTVYRHESVPGDTGKDEYIRLIRDSISKINEGEFEKVVLSRVKSVQGKFRHFLPDIFNALCRAYPHAFVYLFQVNGHCWTGATPEPFICSAHGILRTVSLAGTRPFRESDLDISRWNHKELQEQEYVTLHIERILKNFEISPYEKKGPYVARAGNLLHLRTDFMFASEILGARMPELIAALHPTPAVCGMSTGKAMDFIKSAEKHSRGYYAGFLGPVGISERFCLYVNLRCMRVFDDRLVLYIGGGITQESLPDEEWEETEIKADTLLSVLKQIR